MMKGGYKRCIERSRYIDKRQCGALPAAGRGHEIWFCRRRQSGGGISVSGGEGCRLRAKGRKEGDRLPFCGKPGRMTDLAPDGRARLAGKRGTDIGEVRGEGRFFAGNEAARGLSGEEARVQ